MQEVVAALAEYFRLDRQLLLKLMKIHAGRSTYVTMDGEIYGWGI
jgi:hypothetical protein